MANMNDDRINLSLSLSLSLSHTHTHTHTHTYRHGAANLTAMLGLADTSYQSAHGGTPSGNGSHVMVRPFIV